VADWCDPDAPDIVGVVTYATGASAPNATPTVLTVIGDAELSANVDRVVAAVGARAVAAAAPGRRNWLSAAAVILDDQGARRCVAAAVPRRDGVLLVATGEPSPPVWTAAVDVGAGHVCVLPAQEAVLVRRLAEAVDSGAAAGRCGPVVGVVGGRGGAGASVFAAALAACADNALLIDTDPCGGGIDLLLGGEAAPGLRWPDLQLHNGRLAWSALREVLPRRDGVSILSGTRAFHEIDPGALAAVLDAGRRGGVAVICDLPRHLSPAALCAVQCADLVAVLTSCDVRSAAAASGLVTALSRVNPNVGLVVRGPSPGGLRAVEVAAAAAAPLLASMRAEHQLAQQLEHGGLRLGRRSPLAGAARRVLDVVHRHTSGRAA
jgi:secretion/DNA translocation related CpaE-like protein